MHPVTGDLPLNLIMEMFSTAEPIAAERALRIGILNELIPAVKLEDRVYRLASVIASRSSSYGVSEVFLS